MSTKSVTIRMPEELCDYLAKRSEEEHRSVSNLVISILEDSKPAKYLHKGELANIIFADSATRYVNSMYDYCEYFKDNAEQYTSMKATVHAMERMVESLRYGDYDR